MKKIIYIFSVLLVPFLVSCDKEAGNGFTGEKVDFGESKYFVSFLWVESDTVVLEKELKFAFNDYAKENNSKVKLAFTLEDNQLPENIELYINDRRIRSNTFEINSRELEKGIIKVGIRFLPNTPEGYSSGFLSIINSNLDRINNNDLSTSNEKRLFAWEADFVIVMNPLKQVMIWILAIIILALAIWFLFLRNMIYPKMGKGSIFIQGPYVSSPIKTKGARKIVLAKQAEKQGVFSKIFIGKVVYEVNPFWVEPITLSPFRKRQVRVQLGSIYTISPFTSTFVRGGGNYELKKNNINFRISYL